MGIPIRVGGPGGSHMLLLTMQGDREPWPCASQTVGAQPHTQPALRFAPRGTNEQPSSSLGLMSEQRPRKSCKKYYVEKDS